MLPALGADGREDQNEVGCPLEGRCPSRLAIDRVEVGVSGGNGQDYGVT